MYFSLVSQKCISDKVQLFLKSFKKRRVSAQIFIHILPQCRMHSLCNDFIRYFLLSSTQTLTRTTCVIVEIHLKYYSDSNVKLDPQSVLFRGPLYQLNFARP